MRHARSDYDSIQDASGRIPSDEPVFLLRASDMLAPMVVDAWANMATLKNVDPMMISAAGKQAQLMRKWQISHGSKVPDAPADALIYDNNHGLPADTLAKRIKDDAELIIKLKLDLSTSNHKALLAERKLDRIKSSMANCNKDLVELGRKNASLRNDLYEERIKIRKLEEEIVRLSSTSEDTKLITDSLHMRINDLQRERDSLKNQDSTIIGLNNQLENLSQSLSIITKDNKELESKLKESEEHNERLVRRVDELVRKVRYEHGGQGISDVSGKLQGYMNENISLRDEIKNLKIQLSQFVDIKETPAVIQPTNHRDGDTYLDQHVYVDDKCIAIIKDLEPIKQGDFLKLTVIHKYLYHVVHEAVVHCVATRSSYRVLKCVVENQLSN